MPAKTMTAERLYALAELYQQGQVSELMERTLESSCARKPKRARPRYANYRPISASLSRNIIGLRRSFISSFRPAKRVMIWIMWNGLC